MDHCRNASEPETAPERPFELATAATSPAIDREPADSAGDQGGDLVRDLDEWADDLRQRHLAAALAKLEDRTDLGDDERAAIADCSRALVDEILRCPRWRLRTDREESDETALDEDSLDENSLDEVARELFDVE